VVALEDARAARFDVAVATGWETASALFHLAADRYACFLQMLEDSTYPPGAPERLAASLTTALPVRFITDARWIADTVARFQPGNRALYVRNGIAKDAFVASSQPEPAPMSEPLRIVVVGSQHLQAEGVDAALAAVRRMREPYHLTLVTPDRCERMLEGVDSWLSGLHHHEMIEVLNQQHAMLRLARIDVACGPPLAAFHAGATCVTTPVGGVDEYVRHAWNGLVVGWDDPHGTGRTLDLLARDRSRLHYLRLNASMTARAWPSFEQSSLFMALALRAIRRDPPPNPAAAGVRLASDFASVVADSERQAWRVDVSESRVEDLTSQRTWQWAMALRGAYHRVRAPLGRVRQRLRQVRGR
jgi:hypothetical protein